MAPISKPSPGAVLSAAGDLYSGISAYKSSKKTASLMEQQGQIQFAESRVEAYRMRDEGRRLQQEQMMAYISNGVEISGTPLLVMAETVSMSDFEAAAEEKRGQAAADLANANAKITRSEGKAQMISSIFKAGGSLLGG
jgi:hypothetical protein